MKKILFTNMLYVIAFACCVYLFFETFYSKPNLSQISSVLENISIGFLTSFITYYLTVEVPDKQIKKRKRNQLKALVKNTTTKLFYAYDREYIALNRYLNEDKPSLPEFDQKMFLLRTQYIDHCISMLNDAYHEFCISYSILQEDISEEFVISVEDLSLNYLYCNIVNKYHNFQSTLNKESYIFKKEVLHEEIHLNTNIIDFCIAFHEIEKKFDQPYNLSFFNTFDDFIDELNTTS